MTHSIIHEHKDRSIVKHRVLSLWVWRAHIRNSQPYQLHASTHALRGQAFFNKQKKKVQLIKFDPNRQNTYTQNISIQTNTITKTAQHRQFLQQGPIPNGPYGLCERKASLNLNFFNSFWSLKKRTPKKDTLTEGAATCWERTVCPWNVLQGLSMPSLQTWIHWSVEQDAKLVLFCQSTSRAGAVPGRQ